MYQGRKIGLFRPSVKLIVRVAGEQARAEGECVLQAVDKYHNHTESNSPLSPWCKRYVLWHKFEFSCFCTYNTKLHWRIPDTAAKDLLNFASALALLHSVTFVPASLKTDTVGPLAKIVPVTKKTAANSLARSFLKLNLLIPLINF